MGSGSVPAVTVDAIATPCELGRDGSEHSLLEEALRCYVPQRVERHEPVDRPGESTQLSVPVVSGPSDRSSPRRSRPSGTGSVGHNREFRLYRPISRWWTIGS